jgi:Carboxypeptidase regulatory-like domain/Ankyrin repeats (3 copies)
MSKKSLIDSVEVKTPCTEGWEKMHGNHRVRFCDHCAKDVNNLSEMTRKQAMRLVRASGGNLCIRYVQNPVTKRPIFAEQLLHITRRAPAIAAGVMSASVSFATMTYAQGGVPAPPDSDPVRSCPDKAAQIEVVTGKKTEATAAKQSINYGSVKGVVTDAAGAVIPAVQLNLTNVKTNHVYSAASNDEGAYEFVGVEPGTYVLVAEGTKGFTRKQYDNVAVNESRETPVDMEMTVVESTMVGGMGMVEYSTPLARAVANEDSDLVRELIAQGENVNGKDDNYDKITPLLVAVEYGNVEIVQILLDAGAKVNARDDEKQTPLMRLDDDATPELIEILLRHEAKINLTDDHNNTALILAAQRAKPEVLKALIDAGADVNAVNKDGQTALMNAANNDSLEGVRMLLEAGSKVNLKNNNDETAWDMTSDSDIEDLLVSYGAEAKITVTATTTDSQEGSVPDDK